MNMTAHEAAERVLRDWNDPAVWNMTESISDLRIAVERAQELPDPDEIATSIPLERFFMWSGMFFWTVTLIGLVALLSKSLN